MLCNSGLWKLARSLRTLHLNAPESLLLSGHEEASWTKITYSDFLVTTFYTDAERHLDLEPTLNLLATFVVLKFLFNSITRSLIQFQEFHVIYEPGVNSMMFLLFIYIILPSFLFFA